MDRNRLWTALAVIAAWALIALAWTPPTYLIERTYTGTQESWPAVFGFVLIGFVPWMAATPGFTWLARRFPLTEQSVLRPLLVHVAVGIVALPLIIFIGYLATRFIYPAPAHTQFVLASLLGPMTITTFYSVPTYIAVVAIGQARAYFERYRTRERLLARAELRALEAQLNPHFLFNTLNAISTLGYKDAAKADKALTQLAAMLRVSLKERPQEIALKDEIAFLKDYIELSDMLLPGRAEFHFAIESEAWTARVPTMLLQPLVENAISHGVARMADGGTVTIAARRLGNQLILSVRNPVPETAAPSSGAGIGLANARERLRVLYGDAGALDFTRDAKEASVVVALPFREAEA